MDITQMRYFLSVANQGSISKAAKVMGISQQSMSNAMKALENDLGIQLLARGNKGVSLTHNGEIFKRYADEMWITHQKMMRALNLNQESGEQTRLRMGTVKALSMGFLPPFIVDFMNRHPYISLKVVSEQFKDVVEGVKKGQLDCGVVFRFRTRGIDLFDFGKDLEVRMLAQCKSYCWVSASSALALQQSMGFDQLSKLQTVTLEDVDIDYLEAFYGSGGVNLFDYPLATESGMIAELVAQNYAVCPDNKIGSKSLTMARMFMGLPVVPVAVRLKPDTRFDAVFISKKTKEPVPAIETLAEELVRYSGAES